MRCLLPLLCCAVSLFSASAHAQAEPDDVVQAREAFVEGASLARDMRWGDALDRFEASARLRPHAGTSYNIGICHRALGQYLRARAAFTRALTQHEADGNTALADIMVAEIRTFLQEIERAIGTVDVTLDPPTATIAVNGRPLEVAGSGPEGPVLLAGTLPPGAGHPPPAPRFRVLLDPGVHVVVISRKGFSDVVQRVTVRPGSRQVLPLVLERLPGSLHIDASEQHAVVSVDDLDVGTTPVTLVRPAGSYRVLVRKRGFLTYETDADLSAGERVDLRAMLKPDEPGLTGQWWFWTAVGVVVVGTAVSTYYASRPEPERPPVDGGGLGWAIRVP
jgi:hypothetical protein